MYFFVRMLCIAFIFAFPVSADIFEKSVPDRPLEIDIYVKNAELEAAFPILIRGDGKKTRDLLANYRQALELYRASILEGYAREVTAICIQLKDYEMWLNREAKHGSIGRKFYLGELDYIEASRMNCDTANYHTSPYWRLYSRLLTRYQDQDEQAKEEYNDCISQNACRQRKI